MISAAKPKDVIIEPRFDRDKIGSIWLPEQSRQRCTQGIVKYVGRDVVEVKPGDRVGFGGYSGTLAKLDGEGIFLIMPESEIDFIFGPIDTYEFPIYFLGDRQAFEETIQEIKESILSISHLQFSKDPNAPTVPIEISPEELESVIRYTIRRAPYYKLTYSQAIHILASELKHVPEHNEVKRDAEKEHARLMRKDEAEKNEKKSRW